MKFNSITSLIALQIEIEEKAWIPSPVQLKKVKQKQSEKTFLISSMWKENFIWKSITESFFAFANWWKEEKKLEEIF